MTARLLAIMGSGETSPTMVSVHRQLLERVGAPAVLLDTPFGFQSNADVLVARIQEYFRVSVGCEIGPATMRSAVDPYDSAVARVQEARYVFAGPGSPSYALRQWEGSPIPALLARKLATGGCVTFASAAALTLGVLTVPVYEIYKVGEAPHWLPGLNLLEAAAGLRAAVVPHFDNAEGGNHDTRYCYLGERRLEAMEAALPEDTFVLGVDEHTALVLDLDEGNARVAGLGAVTSRRDGRATVFPSGSVVPIDALAGNEGAPTVTVPAGRPDAAASEAPFDAPAAFDAALARGDTAAAVEAMLELDRVAGAEDHGRALLRSMVVRLGEAAALVGPFVESLLEVRAAARAAGRYQDADAVRDRLLALGVEVHDGRLGTTWRLLS